VAGSSWWVMAGLDVTRFPPHIVALAIAYALAIPIGWDRERSERSAGLRTFPLVAIAACGFVQATERLIVDNPQALARVVEGIIGGVGFIGGGAILKGETSVHGTATAASLWATGAVGAAVGLGSTDVAVVISVITFATLRYLTPFKT
jgi:putative Mg2+ transporter-C (MgtC) family protein